MKEKRYIGKNDKTGRSAKNENEKKKKMFFVFIAIETFEMNKFSQQHR